MAWQKVVSKNDDVWLVSFEASTPIWKVPLFVYGKKTNVKEVIKALQKIEHDDIMFDKTTAELKSVPLPAWMPAVIFKDPSEKEPVVQDPKNGEEKMLDLRPDTVHSTPNQGGRGATISAIILHNTAGGFSGSVSWLCNPKAKASAHIVIGKKGQVAQLVPFSQRAWHAGSGRWNASSIGIEIEATDKVRGMSDVQEKKVIEWCKFLMQKYGIKKDMVLAHRMVSNTDCPGLIWATDEQFNAWVDRNL